MLPAVSLSVLLLLPSTPAPKGLPDATQMLHQGIMGVDGGRGRGGGDVCPAHGRRRSQRGVAPLAAGVRPHVAAIAGLEAGIRLDLGLLLLLNLLLLLWLLRLVWRGFSFVVLVHDLGKSVAITINCIVFVSSIGTAIQRLYRCLTLGASLP